jgi:hypothetical protein
MAAKRRKPKPFLASKAVKAAARNMIGMPPPTRAEPSDTRPTRTKPKYKRTLRDLLSEEGE